MDSRHLLKEFGPASVKRTFTPATGPTPSVTVAVTVWLVPTSLEAVGGVSAMLGWVASQRLMAVRWGSPASGVSFPLLSANAVSVSVPA